MCYLEFVGVMGIALSLVFARCQGHGHHQRLVRSLAAGRLPVRKQSLAILKRLIDGLEVSVAAILLVVEVEVEVEAEAGLAGDRTTRLVGEKRAAQESYGGLGGRDSR